VFDGKNFPVTGIWWGGVSEVEGSDIHVLRNNIASQLLPKILMIGRKKDLTDEEEKSPSPEVYTQA